MLQVTPNGPFGKETHPATPVSGDELVEDLRLCFVAGAEGVHLHVRDDDGAETLDPAIVNEMCRRVRLVANGLGRQVEISLTTGAWIVPDLADRVAMIREWEGVDCATVNLSEGGFERVMSTLRDVNIGIDVGLWAPQEVGLLEASGFTSITQRVSIELAPGEPYFLSGTPGELAQQANDALDDIGSSCPRLTHGMQSWTWPLLEDAFRRGHDTRVGFEDSIYLPDGTPARDNAHLVAVALNLARHVSQP